MTVTTLPDSDLFRSQPLRGLPAGARVDRAKRIIHGARAIELGRVNDARPWKVDRTTLSQVIQFTNQGKRGVKMRFAHPNMSRDGMGRHLGRALQGRLVEGEAPFVAIDAHLSEFATRSPNGNLAEYVLDMAEEDPEVFGLSLHPELDREAMAKIEPDEDGLVPIRLKGLRAIDFVDDPAATRGGLFSMFSMESDSLADLPAQATHLLDTFFEHAPGDVIRARFTEFLDTYLFTRGDTTMSTAPAPAATPAPTPAAAATPAPAAAAPTPAAAPALLAAVAAPLITPEQRAAEELERRSQVLAVCRLARVDDGTRDLMLAAGFDGPRAQDYLSRSGFLSAANPPVSEGAGDPAAKKALTADEKFGAEWDSHKDLFERQGVAREDYIASRKKD